MLILEKEQVESYRYMIAKTVFLILHPMYELLENIPDSNVMLVQAQSRNEVPFYVSLLKGPTVKGDFKEKLYVYYQSAPYARQMKQAKTEAGSIRLLEHRFDDLYKMYFEMAFLDPDRFYALLDSYAWKEAIIKDLFVTSGQVHQKLYKYLSADTVSMNRHQVNDGFLSFSHPSVFNDPFDCNCVFANNLMMQDLFRVLCLTPEHKNILMWSYYAENHKGFCFQYDMSDLIEQIKKIEHNGICIMGNVRYSSIRPKQKAPSNQFSFTDISFYIDAAFTKFEEWKHEREYRFVLISNQLKHKGTFIPFQAMIEKAYEGVQGRVGYVEDSHHVRMPSIPLFKDDVKYQLNE